MKIRLLIGVSIAFICLLILSDLRALLYGLECMSELNNATKIETFGLQICAGNFIFKLSGLIFVIIGLIEIFKKTESLNLKLNLLLVYTLVSIILTLPIYHRHSGFGGHKTHGHSFWNGGLHFH